MTNNAEREGFVREDRYIVLKIRDVKDGLSSLEICELERILKRVDSYRKTTNRIPLVCAVVESDWPEYEKVWQMIGARMTGQARAQASGVPVERLETLREVWEDRAKKKYRLSGEYCSGEAHVYDMCEEALAELIAEYK